MRLPVSTRSIALVGMLLALCAVPIVTADPPRRAAAFAMNARLGRGINMGDMFEAPSEGSWGNPYRPEYFRTIADLGFSHVRIPIRWETPERSMAAPPYTIIDITDSSVQGVGICTPRRVNKYAQVVYNAGGYGWVWQWPNGPAVKLSGLGYTGTSGVSSVSDINDPGQVVGGARDVSLYWHPVMWRGRPTWKYFENSTVCQGSERDSPGALTC